MAEIKIQQTKDEPNWKFDVEVVESDSSTQHRVTMSKEFYQNLKTNREPKEIIEKSFEFLLSREPKESILAEFDVSLISHYFPEFIASLQTLLK